MDNNRQACALLIWRPWSHQETLEKQLPKLKKGAAQAAAPADDDDEEDEDEEEDGEGAAGQDGFGGLQPQVSHHAPWVSAATPAVDCVSEDRSEHSVDNSLDGCGRSSVIWTMMTKRRMRRRMRTMVCICCNFLLSAFQRQMRAKNPA